MSHGTEEQWIDGVTLVQWFDDDAELAFIDVREAGVFGEGHALLAVNIPYSRLEIDITALVPHRATRIVLVGESQSQSEKAIAALHSQTYTNVFAVAHGIDGLVKDGFSLFQGVNVPSKAFAEFVEKVYHTPDIAPAELHRLQNTSADLVFLDCRTVEEYKRFHIPGAISCPASELVERFDDLVHSPDALVVITCAGRTRGVMGAQTLINAGVPNQVKALAGGTQGWRLAGLPFEYKEHKVSALASAAAKKHAIERVAALADRFDVQEIDATVFRQWQSDLTKTTYLFDVRTEEEYLAGHEAGARWVQGVQLIQCLDQWAIVRKARIVVSSRNDARAAVTAHWLQQLGWETYVLTGTSGTTVADIQKNTAETLLRPVPGLDAQTAYEYLNNGAVLLDASSSAQYRTSHPRGAVWVNRSALSLVQTQVDHASAVIVLAEEEALAHLVALDYLDHKNVFVLSGGLSAWTQAKLPVETTPDVPADAARIDYLFWLHDRHHGNTVASAAYLKWEEELPEAVGDASNATFNFSAVTAA